MKFGKSLGNQIEETLPEWRDKFLSYKDLKRRLKLITGGGGGGGGERPAKRPKVADGEAAGDSPAVIAAAENASTQGEEEEFMSLLEAELDKFNSFFIEKEEMYIIRQKDLQDRIMEAISKDSKEDLMKVRKEIVDFHGEMVLLENYSALNYTGLAKILKKYDKRTGALIRQPFIQKVLQQPFFTTDLLNQLVKQCETMLDQIFPKNEPSTSAGDFDRENGEHEPTKPRSSVVAGVPELEEIKYMESLYIFPKTIAALRSLKEIRSGSSTVSCFSLPPLQSNGLEERWDSITPILEQAAK